MYLLKYLALKLPLEVEIMVDLLFDAYWLCLVLE